MSGDLNLLDKVPTPVQGATKFDIRELSMASTRAAAEAAISELSRITGRDTHRRLCLTRDP